MESMTTREIRRRCGRGAAAVGAALVVTALVGGAFFASAAAARVTPAKTPKATVVVKEVNSTQFGEILETKKMLPLYTFDMGTCTAADSCSTTIWPPLLMPKGKTTPGGVSSGLGTQPFGTGRLQVTYHGSPLYTFSMDRKNTVNGNGLGGFTVASVTP